MSNEVFVRRDGQAELKLSYYPGMVEILIIDHWNDTESYVNVNMADWRAMNVAIEKAHNGGVE